MFCSDVRVLDMDSGLSRVNPDQIKRLEIAPETACPQCKSRVVFRTKRRGFLERVVLYPLGFRAYQCEYCLKRFCSRNKSAHAVTVTHATDSVDPRESGARANKGLSLYGTSHYLILFFLSVLLISAAVISLRHYTHGGDDKRQAIEITAARKAPGSPVGQPPSALAATFSFDSPGFVLQVAAMKREYNAEALAETLRQSNFPAFVFKRRDIPFYRVAIGVYSDADSAVRVKDELERQGFEAFLRRWAPE